MKKLLNKINTKTNRSIVLGLAMSFMLVAATSAVQALNVVPFIGNGNSLIERNGSLTIGDSTSASWIVNQLQDCIGSDSGLATESCLDVGSATFINLLVDRSAIVTGATVIGYTTGGGTTSAFPDLNNENSSFIVQNAPGLFDSILITGLAYPNGNDFQPRNLTTKRGTCAREDGTLFSCSGEEVSDTPLTYQWVAGSWGACSDSSVASCNGSWSTSGTGGGSSVGSGGAYASCFISDTQVELANGDFKNIQDVQLGDILKGEKTSNKVLGFHQPKLGDKELYSFNGGEYFVTAEHPFMTTEGWKAFDPELAVIEHNLDIEVGLLEIGDILITDNGEVTLEIFDTKNDSPDTQLYNFILDGDQTYFADGYLVHNKVSCSGSNTCGTGSTCYDSSTGLPDSNTSNNDICSLVCNTPGEVYSSSTRCNIYGTSATEDYCGGDFQRHCRVPGSGGGAISSGSTLNSCSGPTSEYACTGQNSACTFTPAGESVKERDVTCVGSDGNTYADQVCINNGIGTKPDTTSTDGCTVAVEDDAYQCQADGTWLQTNYLTPPCPFGAYNSGGSYSDGNDVCIAGGTIPSNSTCSATVNTYSWDIGNWGLCSGTAGNCSGTPSGGYTGKVDWNGDPFDWNPNQIYTQDPPNSGGGVMCATDDPDNYATSTCIGSVPPAVGSGFLGWTVVLNPSNPTSSGTWYQVNYETSYCNEGGFGCGTMPIGGSTNQTNFSEFTQGAAVSNAFGTGAVGSCGGTSQTSCTSVSGCSWSAGSAGTQTRTLVCRDQNGVVADNSNCPPPTPATSQSCGGGGGASLKACYPIVYPNEINGDYNHSGYNWARTFCDNANTRSECIGPTGYHTNNISWHTDSSGVAPVSAVPYSDWDDVATNSYGDYSHLIIDLVDFDTSGHQLPRYYGSEGSGSSTPAAGDTVLMGPICAWGELDLSSTNTYTWNTGAWSKCVNGNQTRSISCLNSSGGVVSNSLCPNPDPATSQACITVGGGGGSCNPILECCQPDGSGGYIPGPPCA